MNPDGFDQWKNDLTQKIKQKRQAKPTKVAGTEGRIKAATARQTDSRGQQVRQKRQAALENPFAPPPGHRPTARQVSLGADPNQGRAVNYIPPKEKGGKKIWDGRRNGLDFSAGLEATVPHRDQGCYHRKKNCTGDAEAIDHLEPFSQRQAGLARYLICDGRNHFEACLKEEVQKLYDAPTLVWSCTSCNSSKGGVKGLYENIPQFKEPCPGEECTVPAGGEEV